MVVIMLIAPIIEERPAKWSEKIQKSTLSDICPILLKGGYIVHPKPAPILIIDEITSNINENGNNIKLKLFNRGKIISVIFKYNGNIQFPKPPITIGIIKKKIITNAWLVTITLYSWPLIYTQMQFKRINTEYLNPTKPINIAKIIYNVPMSLWFTLINQRLIFNLIYN